MTKKKFVETRKSKVNDPPLKAVAFYTAPRRCDLTL